MKRLVIAAALLAVPSLVLAQQVRTGPQAYGDWRTDAPGVTRLIKASDLPAPGATESTANMSRIVARPAGALPKLPTGFTASLYAEKLSNPRALRVAPNGDLFVAESEAGRIRVLRPDGSADSARTSSVFATGLHEPYGIAFFPPGPDPKWVYVAETDKVERFPYRNGDLKATGPAAPIVPALPSRGGHWTRDIAFSPDGKRMYVSVGSGSNDAESLDKAPSQFIANHATGAAWGNEVDRADLLSFDPQGHDGQVYATGLRNCAGLTVAPDGTPWCATNERDGLGDNLPPDYATSVKQGGFYGWPWFYDGAHENPEHKGERTDLAGKVITPDVQIQPHSAPLGIAFYTGSQFPAEYRGNAFVTLHGSWNRGTRTGYKVVRLLYRDGKPTGAYQDFMVGMVASDSGVWARPVGVAVAKDGALFVSEDGNDTVWRITYSGK